MKQIEGLQGIHPEHEYDFDDNGQDGENEAGFESFGTGSRMG